MGIFLKIPMFFNKTQFNPGFSMFFQLGKTVLNRAGKTGLGFLCHPWLEMEQS